MEASADNKDASAAIEAPLASFLTRKLGRLGLYEHNYQREKN